MKLVKRLLNFLLILIGVLLIAVCADLMTNKLGKTELESLDKTDRGAVEEICEIIDQFDDKYGNEKVWDDSFNLRSEACLITRQYGMVKGYTYAVNMSFPKNMFAQRIEMPEKYSDIPVYRFAYLTPFTFSLGNYEEGGLTEINGRTVYAAVFDAQTVKYNGAGSLEEDYVEKTFKSAVESVDIPDRNTSVHFEINEENVALTGLQYRIIDDMLGTSNPEKLKEMISEYVAVREYQAEKYPEFSVRKEQTELSEGCARYAFYNVSKLIDHDITYFNKEESESITFYSAYYYLCTGRYNSDIAEFLDSMGDEYVGAALCRIIRDNDLSANWENRLSGNPGEDFTSQYSLIKKYCGKECGEFSDKTINDIKRTYNYDEIISMARTLVKEYSN